MYIETIRVKDIERYSSKENSMIIDLRSVEEYNKSHIPNAINIPFDDIDLYMTQLKEYENMILYCDRGNLSLLAGREISRQCNSHIISIGGGFLAYKQYYRLLEASHRK